MLNAQPQAAYADTDEWTTSEDPDREDLEVQVRLSPDDFWHRKAIGATHTACGLKMDAYASRDESYEDSLCPDGCYSRFELAIARPRPRRLRNDTGVF